jgi:hypothetical protein
LIEFYRADYRSRRFGSALEGTLCLVRFLEVVGLCGIFRCLLTRRLTTKRRDLRERSTNEQEDSWRLSYVNPDATDVPTHALDADRSVPFVQR